MKKNIIKILITLVFVFTMFGGISAVNFNHVKAEENQIKYVALGDSIADGTALDGYQKYTFVQGSYTHFVKTSLEEHYNGQVNSTTYAMASSNTTEFLALLNGEETERYSDLNTSEVLQTIKDADIITVCIGANDILLPAINNIFPFITGQATVSDMEAILANGLTVFTTNYLQILTKLSQLNPNALIVCNDIYNPYKCFQLTGQMAEFAENSGFFSVSNINKMGEITEVYLAGGTNSAGEDVVGLNQLMEGFINHANANINSNFKFVKIKESFDMVAELDASGYAELVNADASKITMQNFMQFTAYADPHPTQTGHMGIGYAIMDSIKNDLPTLDDATEPDEPQDPINPDDPVNPDDPLEPDDPIEPEEPTYVTVAFVTYGGHLTDEMGQVISSKQVEVNTLMINYMPSKEGVPFGGWYTDVEFTQKWNPNEPIVEDMTLYAKWITLKYSSSSLNQDITNAKEIEFKLDIPDPENFDISWYVQEGESEPQLVEGEKEATFMYMPTKSGVFKIRAEVNGVKTVVANVTITRSKVSMVKIVLKNKDNDNNFTIEVVENSYSDSQLIWYQSSNEYNEAPKQICVGKSVLKEKFNSSCKIWVVYKESGEVISNVLEINIEPEEPTYVTVTFITYGGHLTDEMGQVINSKQVEVNTLMINYMPSKEGVPFGGWYTDVEFTQKWNPNEPIVEDMTLYAKWITLKYSSSSLSQDITNAKEIEFKLDIPDPENFDISWYVQEGESEPQLVKGEKEATFMYMPTKSGVFTIRAEVNGVKTVVANVTITRSKVSMVKIVLKNKDIDNNFTIEVVENSYSDSQLIWYQSSNEYNEAPKQIGAKSVLRKKFNSSCKIWVVYKESGEVISNVLEINIEATAQTDVIVGVLLGIVIVGAFVIAVVITKKKYSDI